MHTVETPETQWYERTRMGTATIAFTDTEGYILVVHTIVAPEPDTPRRRHPSDAASIAQYLSSLVEFT